MGYVKNKKYFLMINGIIEEVEYISSGHDDSGIVVDDVLYGDNYNYSTRGQLYNTFSECKHAEIGKLEDTLESIRNQKQKSNK